MPQWLFQATYPQPVAQVFALFCRPANRVRMIPENLRMELLAAPDKLQKGSCLKLRVRQYGLAQTIELEVTAFTQDASFTEEQVRGPFRSWCLRYQFEQTPEGGTCLTETLDYEPPGGMLGLLATPAVIERDLRNLHDLREPLLRQLLADPAG